MWSGSKKELATGEIRERHCGTEAGIPFTQSSTTVSEAADMPELHPFPENGPRQIGEAEIQNRRGAEIQNLRTAGHRDAEL